LDIRLGLISAYSFLYGVHKPDALLDKAASLGIKTVSICDLNNLYGVHSFLENAKERNIRPIIGAALTVEQKPTPDSTLASRHSLPHTPHSSLLTSHSSLLTPPHLHCFVENRAGFSRLCEILSVRNKDTKNFNPIPLLRDNCAGITLASANQNVLKELAGNVKNLYCVVTPDDLGGLGSHKSLNLPLAFLDNSAFLDSSDYPVHRVLRAIGLNKTVGSLCSSDTIASHKADSQHSVNVTPLSKSGCERILKTNAELSSLLDSWPEAVKGSMQIAKDCQFYELFDGFIFPSYGDNPVAELKERVYTGAVSRYGELGDMEIDRIEYELEVIERMGFAPYFLRMDDIVNMAKTDEYNRTCGRGSGAASIVSYSLGITNVDPIAHDLYFERFLNPARPDPPDIDVDFAWDERDGLIRTVIEKFGSDYCARVANHNFFRPRSALRETAKAYGFADAEISQLERKLFDYRENDENISPLWKEIYQIAARIEGLPRGLSMHCGGIVITPQPISRYAPIEKSLEGFPLLAWEKDGTEAAGFVKIDLLGNRSLAVIRDAVSNVELGVRSEELGVKSDELEVRSGELEVRSGELREKLSRAICDEATVAALARGDSIGVFYIESPAMRQLQKKTGAGDFDHIVIHSSIIRPAANKFISEYVRRLKGKKWEPLHPRLDKILNESYGILCYQEDVSKTAVALAGFDEVGADKLRKVIAKKAGAEKLKVYEKQFFEGCRKNGVSEKTINEIWAMMLSFDGYSFCKPHSASYAMVSFQSAYLRVHHPAEFMAAVLSNQGGYYRPHAYVAECRRMGLLTEGPDVNISAWKYYGVRSECGVRSEELGVRSDVCRGKVVIGFMAIKGLSVTGANAIFEERERGGVFKNLDDFIHRVKLSRDDIVSLCPAGVFDSISAGLPRPLQARMLLEMISIKCKTKNEELFPAHNQSSLNIPHSTLLTPHSSLDTNHSSLLTPHSSLNNPSSLNNSLHEEYNALGFLRNAHPLILWKDEVTAVKNRVLASGLSQHIERNVKLIGWPITQKEVWTKDGLTMSFLSLEDETAMYETVIFPDIYDRYNKLLFDQQPLLIYGLVKDDQGAVILEVTRIDRLS